jgi:tetratricopeptide (TPR) repeat protein
MGHHPNLADVMKLPVFPIALMGLPVTLASHSAASWALTPVEVQKIAKQTTVQIVGCDFGSGVIIKKNNNIYTVLTVAHNFKNSGCKVVTSDDRQHSVSQIKTFPNRVDLAVFQFTSDKVYPTAKVIDNSDRVEAAETIYLSGFPYSTAINNSVFTFIKGDVIANPNKQQTKGYSLIYNNNTLPGHSGGPVWNAKGELIAIHGQGDIDEKFQPTINERVRIKTGFNLGITVNTFAQLAAAAGVDGYKSIAITEAKAKPVDNLLASATINESRGNYQGMVAKGALTDLNRAISLGRNDAPTYLLRGAAKYLAGSKKEAIPDLDRSIFLDNTSGDAYTLRGSIKSDLGDKKAAISDLDRAIALDGKNALAYTSRGLAKFGLGQNRAALSDLDRSIVLDSQDAVAYFSRGLIQSSEKNYQQAIVDFNRSIVLDPQEAVTYYSRGSAKWQLGDKKGAMADYNRSIELDPKDATAYYIRGSAKLQSGDNRGAAIDLKQSIAISPQDGNVHYMLGLAQILANDRQGGIASLKQAAAFFKQQGQTTEYREAMKLINEAGK